MLQNFVSGNSHSNISAVEAMIAIHNLNHYFGVGDLRKQVLCDINLEINA